MESKKVIQIQDHLQKNHYFLYNNKQYPFNIELFNVFSKYFLNNPELIQPSKIINLINENLESNLSFTDDSIQSFIDYSQSQQIFLNNGNVVSLNYLAKKYEINSLIDITNEYINENH